MSWASLQDRYPWPDESPKLKPYRHGPRVHESEWYEILSDLVNPVFVEVGAWTGKTSFWLLDRFLTLRLVAVDLWDAVAYRFVRDMHAQFVTEGRIAATDSLADLYRANLWEQRERLVVIHDESVNGMHAMADAALRASVVYIDAAHDYQHVKTDILTALKCFPDALICGDDYYLDGVIRSVHEVADERGFGVLVSRNRLWRYVKR